jgi:glycine cleavage system aminomethyltransferase T
MVYTAMRNERGGFESDLTVMRLPSDAGADLGVRDAGCHALDALRIEAGCRAWGAELGPDETPFEAGLTFAVKLDKPGFIGRKALLAVQGAPLCKKRLTFVIDDPALYAWGGESIVIDGQPVGELSSAGLGFAAGRCVALGYVRGAAAQTIHRGTAVAIDLWGVPVSATAWDRWPAAAA